MTQSQELTIKTQQFEKQNTRPGTSVKKATLNQETKPRPVNWSVVNPKRSHKIILPPHWILKLRCEFMSHVKWKYIAAVSNDETRVH